ncbi:AraC family transcriptional regulator [Vallitalea guaymasensis]|uniref:Helix-turn-helix transcriptional regulator n=1 Tax=Vallitalea guaymasensis TaxID=1185412 RepID=A0A8J8MBZ2_9FIRM|nr:AraC family transcriptional regulator [Vallitalea guaymasensis]QUH29885.1 helix-turn-helix transcriptional regulator [Vallitalea guaymasensis]
MFKIKTNILPKTINMGFINYVTPWSHFERVSDEYIMYIIKTGDLYLTVDKKNYHLKENDAIFIEKGLFHTGYKKAPCSYYYIHFEHANIANVNISNGRINDLMKDIRKRWISSSIWSTYEDEDSNIYIPTLCNIGNLCNDIFNLLDKALDIIFSKTEYYKLQISCIFNEILILYAKAYINSCIEDNENKNTYHTISNLIFFLNKNYPKNITIEIVEEITHFNYDYMNRLFKKNTNYTIMEYLTKIRIDTAKSLVASTSMKYYEIGQYVGYNNQYYFSRIFKKITGMTISKYAKTHRYL